MWIRLIKEWHSYRKGSVLELPDTEGLELIIAHKAIKAKPTDDMEKYLSGPPHDKMMRKSDKQK